MKRVLAVAALVCGALVSQEEPRQVPGPRAGGRLLPTGWALKPAGTQIDLGPHPTASLATPNGKFVIVLHQAARDAAVWVLDAVTLRRVAVLGLPAAWQGMALTPNGQVLYVSGGGNAEVYEIGISPEGELQLLRTFPAVAEQERTDRDFLGDLQVTPDGRLLYVADVFRDQILVINPSSGRVIERFRTGRRPYRILFHPDGKSYFVTSWADASVHQHETDTGRALNFARVGHHPTDMVWRDKKTGEEEEAEEGAGRDPFPYKARLFVAVANTNSVQVLGVSESKDLRRMETINVSLHARQPAGMTPSALALGPDGSRLIVACSDANAAAVVNVSLKRSTVVGFVPTGWYPVHVRALPDGRLLALNAKGTGDAVPHARGSMSVIRDWADGALAAQTEAVLAGSAYQERDLEAAHYAAPGHPVPRQPGEKSPIEHVVYIVKEGRAYDEILGDIGKGRSRAGRAQFGVDVTPNHHKLANEFVLIDNFYAIGDSPAEGFNWATAAIAPDFVQRLAPSRPGLVKVQQEFEGGDPAALPPAGYLWTQVLSAGLPMRNFGFGLRDDTVRDPALRPATNTSFRGSDLDYYDTDRAKTVLAEIAKWEAGGTMPRFVQIRLANDRTSGLAAGKISPRSAVADNDLALGMLVEALSRGKFWPKMAIFVVESHAGAAPDFTDRHRVPAFVISPYAKRNAIDSDFYNSASMLRTMELILGLNPMTHFDAGAPPMVNSFQAVPDVRPYTGEKPRIPLDTRNPA